MSALFVQSYVEDFKTEANIQDIVLTTPELEKHLGTSLEIPTLREIMKFVCGNKIGENYKGTLAETILKSPQDFEMIFVFANAQMDVPNDIIGFLIAEKGECKKRPNTWCVNLICSKGGKGKLLLSLYLYSILKSISNGNNVDPVGLLELAGGYYNIAGFCMYSKLGFEYDQSLYGDDCFSEMCNLPMIVDLQGKQPSYVVNLYMGQEQPTQLHEICGFRGETQLLYAICLNLLRYVDVAPSEIISFYTSDDYAINYPLLYKTCGKNRSGVLTFIDTVKSNTSQENANLLSKFYKKKIPYSEMIKPQPRTLRSRTISVPETSSVGATTTSQPQTRRRRILGGRSRRRNKKRILKGRSRRRDKNVS